MLTPIQIDIRDRLIEGAFVELRQHVRGLRPGTPSTFWPDFGLTRQELRETLISRARDGINTREAESRPDPPTADQISRADECMTWRSYVTSDDARRKLMARIQCYATRRSWSMHCRKRGWSKSTAERRFNVAIEQITIRVCKESVFFSVADEELMMQLHPSEVIKNSMVGANAA